MQKSSEPGASGSNHDMKEEHIADIVQPTVTSNMTEQENIAKRRVVKVMIPVCYI